MLFVSLITQSWLDIIFQELLTCWYMGFLMVTFVSFLVYASEQKASEKESTLDNLFNGVYWGVVSFSSIFYIKFEWYVLYKALTLDLVDINLLQVSLINFPSSENFNDILHENFNDILDENYIFGIEYEYCVLLNTAGIFENRIMQVNQQLNNSPVR